MLFGNEVNPMNDIVEEIKLIKKLGCDFAEITIEDPFNLPEILEIRKAEIKKTLESFKNPPAAHFTWQVDLGAINDEVRKYWIKEAKLAMRTAKKIGCVKFTVHYSSSAMVLQSEKLRKKVLDNYIKSLSELEKFAEKIGIQLMLENAAIEGKELHLKNFAYVADNVPGLKINVDISHAFLNGGMDTVENFLLYFADKIAHLHFSDSNGNYHEHLSIGNGKINYKKVVELLKKISYDGTITFEIFELPRSNVTKSIIKIKKLLA